MDVEIDALYESLLAEIYGRFPSVQNSGFSSDAYKPGLRHMEAFDNALGRPSCQLRSIHVAGTNGKGSVSSMLASVLAANGYKVGLYTSPHLLDFRERARIVADGGFRLIGKDYVSDFLSRWRGTFDSLDLSFFEITTGLAFRWFADEQVDIAVVEVGLGGRLDSTNILVPELSVVTSIGLDHCAQLGGTRALIAGEKAGIFKSGVPAVVGERDEETAPIFEATARHLHCPLFFASDAEYGDPGLDLEGDYQAMNVRTVMLALDLLGVDADENALASTARRTGFRGRWEKLNGRPDVICDIGHNPPALKLNFAQLGRLMSEGKYDNLTIVYGVMADKDLSSIVPLMPDGAEYIFCTPGTPRALEAGKILEEYRRCGGRCPACVGGSVENAISLALSKSGEGSLIYVGGSTYVVCEAQRYFENSK